MCILRFSVCTDCKALRPLVRVAVGINVCLGLALQNIWDCAHTLHEVQDAVIRIMKAHTSGCATCGVLRVTAHKTSEKPWWPHAGACTSELLPRKPYKDLRGWHAILSICSGMGWPANPCPTPMRIL